MIHVTRFSASWCGPCKALAPTFKELEGMFPDVKFITVDVEENPASATLYEIRNVPTVIIEKDNATVARMSGLSSRQKYIDTINALRETA